MGVAMRVRKAKNPPMIETKLAVVLGAGQVGRKLTELLLASGRAVRLVRRGPPLPSRPGLTQLAGNLADPSFAEEAGRGAAVIFDCLNPAYHQWDERLLPLGRGSLHAAVTAGARLVAVDNLYCYGRPSGPLREDSPMVPSSHKGTLRARLSELRLEAHAAGKVELAIGRASDFFGPETPTTGVFGERFFQRVLAGRSGEAIGDPDQPHSYSYTPDVASALLALASPPAAASGANPVWHLPAPPAESTRAFAARFAAALGVPLTISRLPTLMLRAVGLFDPTVREVVEMTYQWETPFVIDDSRFRKTFGLGHTPVEAAVAETAAWAKRAFGTRSAA
jgi:nucleoside-diphosphate-sugar epimerase